MKMYVKADESDTLRINSTDERSEADVERINDRCCDIARDILIRECPYDITETNSLHVEGRSPDRLWLNGIFTLNHEGFTSKLHVDVFRLPDYDTMSETEIFSTLEQKFSQYCIEKLRKCETEIAAKIVCSDCSSYFKTISEDFNVYMCDYDKITHGSSNPFGRDWGINFCLEYNNTPVATSKLSLRWNSGVPESDDLIKKFMSQIKKNFKIQDISELVALFQDVVCKNVYLKFNKMSNDALSALKRMPIEISRNYDCLIELYNRNSTLEFVCNESDCDDILDDIEDYLDSQMDTRDQIQVSKIEDGHDDKLIKQFVQMFI